MSTTEAKIGDFTMETKPEGMSHEEWMAQVPFNPAPPPELTHEERLRSLERMRLLKVTAADYNAGHLNHAQFVNERQIFIACHELGDYDLALAKLSSDEALERSDAAGQSRADAERFLKLAVALDERTKYTYRSF